ncbi:MAG: PH domain-containing protein [Acidimicrobiia bacterium]|nr:PH domain-containing protein [Acidimicrobiia bacterium]
MPFPARLLSVDEEVAVETRPHWTYLAAQFGAFVVMITAVICVTVVVDGFPLPAIVAIGVMAGVSAVAAGIRLVRWANTYYLVTDRRIVYWKGVPRWRGIELGLDLVDEIDANQTIGQRLLGVGTLAVRSVVEGHVRRLPFVPRPAAVRLEVYRLQREAARRGADPVPPEGHETAAGDEFSEPALDIPDQIRKLYELVELGILSEAEFEEKKRDLLRRL